MTCGVNDGEKLRTADIATMCNASVHHLLQVVHMLQESGYVETMRGRSGGLRLAQRRADICIGEVFRLFESGTPFAECFDPAANTCPLTQECRLRSYLIRALDAFYTELDRITLDDLVRGNCGLEKLLAMAPTTAEGCAPKAIPG
jgi:Rrf2 family nitric oxide-sensitive transcriptional repressor